MNTSGSVITFFQSQLSNWLRGFCPTNKHVQDEVRHDANRLFSVTIGKSIFFSLFILIGFLLPSRLIFDHDIFYRDRLICVVY